MSGLSAVTGAIEHIARSIPASDGQQIAFDVTKAVGKELGVLVHVNGTAETAVQFRGMADQLAERGITSFAVQARTHLDAAGHVLPDPGYGIHSEDLSRVVDLAMREHPEHRATVAGTSLGAVIAMHYNAVHNPQGLVTVALAPVVLDKFLPFDDKLKLVGSVAMDRIGRMLVNTPMSAGRMMAHNPASVYVTDAERLADTHVPARIFRDVLEMNVDTLRHRKNAGGKVFTLLAGDDDVSFNLVTRAFNHAAVEPEFRSIETVPGVGHAMTEEYDNRRLVDRLASIILRPPSNSDTRWGVDVTRGLRAG